VRLEVNHLAHKAQYHLKAFRTGFHSNDAYSAWLETGAPKDLSPSQQLHLNDLTRDLPVIDRRINSGADGKVSVEIPMRTNDVVLVELLRDTTQN
jgi:xylan 1,4-beta-xylosidase